MATLAAETGVRPTRRVLFVTGEFPPRTGGVGDHVVRLSESFATSGMTCHVATESRSEDDTAARVYSVGNRYPMQALSNTIRVARRLRPDVVHLHYQAGAFARPGEMFGLARLLPRLTAASRLAVTFHDLLQPYLFPKAGPLRARVVRSLARCADAAIYVDELDRRRAVEQGYGEANSHWIPAGPTIEPPMDVDDRSAARKLLSLDAEDFIVGFLRLSAAQQGRGRASGGPASSRICGTTDASGPDWGGGAAIHSAARRIAGPTEHVRSCASG